MTLKRFLALCGLVAVGLCPSRPAAAQHFDPKALYEIVGPGGLCSTTRAASTTKPRSS